MERARVLEAVDGEVESLVSDKDDECVGAWKRTVCGLYLRPFVRGSCSGSSCLLCESSLISSSRYDEIVRTAYSIISIRDWTYSKSG